jgi:hypothetical protein
LFLPGSSAQQQVNFATVGGNAILEGDVMLGPATSLHPGSSPTAQGSMPP